MLSGSEHECKSKGIRNIIIESAGFSDQGDEGAILQREINEYVKRYGLRILGPNCLGVLDNHSRFCCFYGAYQGIMDVFNKRGGVSYIIQSGGARGIAIEWLMD